MSRRCLGCMECYDEKYAVCPRCGFVVNTNAEEAIHMQPGTLLHDRYIVGKVLGFGGFGVTYIGWDGTLEQKVAIKEYLPGEFSTRMPGQSRITVFNGEKTQQFEDGLSKFVDEAKRLAKFQNENGIVKIFDSFLENDTAYIIMEYLEGETLTSYLKREKTIPEDQAVEMLLPVMHSLQIVHAEGLLHRDIAPDNIFLTSSGEVKLIDFGASRYATTSHSRSLTVIIKPGYSPEEQYRSRGDQGAYTDVYALAATLYRMITGKTPPDAMERRAKYENQNKDILEEPHKLEKNISLHRENAILNAMNVRIEDRTPDVGTFIQELNSEKPAKRRSGRIRKIDIYSWPTWLKVLIPAVLTIAICFGTLLATGVINFSLYTSEVEIPENMVEVPYVEGLQQEEAISRIQEHDLIAFAGGNIESEYIPVGTIILQSPNGASYLSKNSVVTLSVSSGVGITEAKDGLSTVPFVVWDAYADAHEKMKKAGLGEPIIETAYDENVPAGQVISQSVEAGEKIAEGTSIVLVVSMGPKPFAMPDLSGMDVAQAKELLESQGIVYEIEFRNVENVQENTILEQNVAAGDDIKRGDTVTIVVCSRIETKEVPDLTGMNVNQAQAELARLGFKFAKINGYSDEHASGEVYQQTPAAGTSQVPGSTIVLYVSIGNQPIKVLCDYNDGTGNTVEIVTAYEKPYGTLTTPTRMGYVFTGWYSAPDGGVRVEADTQVTTPTAHTLYARWSPHNYTITFDANGGTVSTKNITVVYDTKIGELPVPVRSGYNFGGWMLGETLVTSDTRYTNADNQTLRATWIANQNMVAFNASGGTVSVANKSVTYGNPYGTLPTPTRTGYTFAGWCKSENGNSTVTADTIVDTAKTHTLYARWEASRFVVSFDANGGSVSISTRDVFYDSEYGTLPVPTRNNHIFAGWYTSKDGGTAVTDRSIVTASKDHTLYAHWVAATGVVAFNANGGTVSIANKTLNQGEEYGELPTPIREGYVFDGWYTDITGGTKVSSSNIMGAASVTLYAHWGNKSYTLSFDANGGNAVATTKQITNGSAYGTLPEPTRSGYMFSGWTTARNGGTTISSDVIVAVNSDQVLYAQWTISQLIVSFDANGGTVSETSRDVNYGAAYGALPTPTRTGYTFNGWYTASSGGTQVTSATTMGTSAVTVYAQWTVNSHTITFNANGGAVSETSRAVNFGAAYGTLPTPTRDGYAFSGWYTSASGGSKVDSSATMKDADVTLYAQWASNSYTLTFNANGGTVSEASRAVAYGAAYGTLPTPTKSGYAFSGWYTAATGGTLVTQSTTMGTANVTIYAQWSTNSYTLTFNANGGTVSETSRALAYGASYGTLPTPTKSGYAFSGWYTAASGGTAVTSSTTMGTANVTIYAHWSANSYTLTFNANGGTVSETSRSLAYGATYGTLPTPTRNGYVFNGWYTASSGGTKVTSSTTMGTANATVYAQWSANSFTLTFNANGGKVSEASRSVAYGAAYGTLPTPTRDGYVFSGWYTASSGGTAVTSSTTMGTANVTIYAQWSANSYTLTFNANGGTVSETSRTLAYGESYGSLPTPTLKGHTFNGWYTAASGGTQVTSSTAMGNANVTLYAHWTANTYTLYFDANGGTCSETRRVYTYAERTPYSSVGGDFPTPTRSGYTFKGWYDKDIDVRIGDFDFVTTRDVYLYAKWEENTVS